MEILQSRSNPTTLFVILTVVNLLNYVDRGIIPGATNEFNDFIMDDLKTDTPSVYLGLLQSSFIVGFSVCIVLFSHLLHYYPPFYICGFGLTIWIVAVMLCGIARYTGSFYFLLFCRMLSGAGEASFQCSIPPWIEKSASSEKRGFWLSFFFTAIPVGTAVGYAYSAAIAESVGWEWAFFIEAFMMAPFVVFLFSNAHKYPLIQRGQEKAADDSAKVENSDTALLVEKQHKSDGEVIIADAKPPTMFQEFKIVAKNLVFLSVSLGYAAQNASLIGLATFGSAFIIGLGFFDSETESSTVFGILVSTAGIFGTPLGGYLMDMWDKILKKRQLEGTTTDTTPFPIQSIIGTTKQIIFFSLLGFLNLCVVYFIDDKWLFLFVLCVGCTLLFATTTGINLLVMLSVPEQHRGFAVALNSVIIHALGDVPSPVIAGILKDSLAPGCTGNDIDDKTSSSPDCRDDSDGLRLTMLIISFWLIWCVLLFSLANIMISSRPETVRHLLIPSRKVLDPDQLRDGSSGDSIGDITEKLISENDEDGATIRKNAFNRKTSSKDMF